jgi:hypothetical protein
VRISPGGQRLHSGTGRGSAPHARALARRSGRWPRRGRGSHRPLLPASAAGGLLDEAPSCGWERLRVVSGAGSGREDDGSGGVAADYLGERPGGIGERVAGGDRNRRLAAGKARRELAQPGSVRADGDAGDRDTAPLAERVGGDGRQPPAVGDRLDRAGGLRALPNRLMSPISATMTSAVNSPTPGSVRSRSASQLQPNAASNATGVPEGRSPISRRNGSENWLDQRIGSHPDDPVLACRLSDISRAGAGCSHGRCPLWAWPLSRGRRGVRCRFRRRGRRFGPGRVVRAWPGRGRCGFSRWRR